MDRIRGTTVASALPAANGTGAPGYFTAGDPSAGVAATIITADWLNLIQEELVAVVAGAGLTLNPADRTQLFQAINLLVSGTSATPAAAVAHFARSTAPAGWLKANGATVSRATYATLFGVIGTTYGAGDGATTFQLPDLRGEFLRGLDDGRGIDGGRALGSGQLDALQGHWHEVYGTFPSTVFDLTQQVRNAVTVKTNDGYINFTYPFQDIRGPISDGVNGTPRTAAETRPRNVALLACIKY